MKRFFGHFVCVAVGGLASAACGADEATPDDDATSDVVDEASGGDTSIDDATDAATDPPEVSSDVEGSDTTREDAVTDSGADTEADAEIEVDADGGGGGDERPCDDPGLSKGPWVIGVGDTTARILWETCRAGTDQTVTFSAEGSEEPTSVEGTESEFVVTVPFESLLREDSIDYAGTWWMHEVRLADLSPGTCYRYALELDASTAGRFCTARPAGANFTFLSIGDTNPALGNFTSQLLAAVLPPDGSENPDFTVHGGDIQYYDSLLETWQFWFGRMRPLLAQGAFFPAVGNHEYETPTEFAEYYTRFFGGGGFDGDVRWYSFEWGGVWFFSLSTEEAFGPDSEQGRWLSAGLEAAQASEGFRFSIVYLHRPFFSCGDNDHHPEEQALWEPIFLERNVPLVIQAHMHSYERFTVNGITYVTSGGGGGGIGEIDENIDRPECEFLDALGGFFHVVMFDVTDEGISGRTIDNLGAVRDSFSIPVAR
jgi:hypothetical protein